MSTSSSRSVPARARLISCDAEDILGVRDDDRRLADVEAAIKAIDPDLLAARRWFPGGRSHGCELTSRHRYFDTQHEIVADVVTTDLSSLKLAVSEPRRHLADAAAGQTTLDINDTPRHGE